MNFSNLEFEEGGAQSKIHSELLLLLCINY